jgi:hypothetical protein
MAPPSVGIHMNTPNETRSSSPRRAVPPSFCEAAQRNNDGVEALWQGDEDRAMALLTDSIRLMKSELTKPGPDDGALHDADEADHHLTSSSSGDCYTPTEMVPLSTSPEDVTGDDDAVLQDLMFNQAIAIPTGSAMPDDVDIHIYSAVVVFNLALSHQQKARASRRRPSSPSSSSSATTIYDANMLKAEKLYQVILKLMSDHVVCRSPTGIVVMLAAVNNLTALRLHRTGGAGGTGTGSNNSRHEEAQGQVQATLSTFVARNSTLLQTYIEHEPTIQGLLVNVLLFRAPVVAAAA